MWSWREAVIAAGMVGGVGTLKGVPRVTCIWFLKGETGTRVTQSVECGELKGHWGDTVLKPFLCILWGAPNLYECGCCPGAHSWGKAAVAVAPEHTVTFSLCRTVLGQHGDRTRTGGTASLKRVTVKHSK